MLALTETAQVSTYVMADENCVSADKHVNEDEEEGEAHVRQLRAFRSVSTQFLAVFMGCCSSCVHVCWS